MSQLTHFLAASSEIRRLVPRLPNNEKVTEPTVGASISALADLPDSTGLGRIGCFAVNKTARSWDNVVLLSNDHVLNSDDTPTGKTLYQPAIEDRCGEIWFDRYKLNPIAGITGDRHNGSYRFAYPDEDAQDYYIDCATAKLANQNARPNEVAVFDKVARLHPKDIRQNRRLPVRLLGVHGGPAGYVTGISETVEHVDGRLCPNSIVIETLPGHAAFAVTGDSGALIVDAFDRAVGMLWGIDLGQPTRAFACHLLPVLDCLGLVPSTSSSVLQPIQRRDLS